MRSASEHDQELGVLASSIAAETDEVQEGFATYIEYSTVSSSVKLNDFRRELVQMPEVYLCGFDLARKVEKIIAPSELEGLSEQELVLVQQFALLDITRFAMNIPVPQTEDDTQIVAAVQTHSPNRRWRTVLEELARDADRRRALINRAAPMFGVWLKKSENRFTDGLYTGITYGDNIENIIAEIFPELPYVPPWEAWFIKVIETKPELVSEYFSRSEGTTELRITPRTRIAIRRDLTAKKLCRAFDHLAAQKSGGCYVRLIPSLGTSTRSVGLEAPLKIPPGDTAILIHETRVTVDSIGKRLWNYQGYGIACVVQNDSIPNILEHLRWSDAVVVVDCELEASDPFAPLEWSEIKFPLFLNTTPTGSLGSVIRTLSDERIREGSDVVAMVNWQHFEGAGSDQIILLWTIPRSTGGNAAVIQFATNTVMSLIELWREHAKLPEGVRFIVKEEVIVSHPVNEKARAWRIKDDDPIIHAPANADVATAHLLDFGW
ncbi:MAG TPA: hypothetical protein VGC66_00605 [Pyrinomonadaceae bacterium]|jgi:hypothetical protein